MPPPTMRVAHLALSLTFVTLLAAPALAGDILLGTNGKMQGARKAQNPPKSADYGDSNWTVQDERLDVITYRIGNLAQEQQAKTASVAEIFFDPSSTPQEYFDAVAAEEDGNFAGARDLWKSLSERGKRPWMKARGAYGVAVSYYYEGDFARASQALGSFKSKHSNSRYVPDAIRFRANALLNAGKVADARSEFESIRKLPGLGEDEKLAADYWVAWIDEQVSAGKKDAAGLKKALKAYQALKARLGGRSSATAASLKIKCETGIASCQLALGDWKTPFDMLTKMVGKTTEPQALAEIHTKLGNCLLTKNASGHDRAVYREALDHFLRVVVLYGPTLGAENAYAESLYRCGSLFYELRPTTTDEAAKEKKRRWGSYSRREYNECIRLFPASKWAKMARADLR